MICPQTKRVCTAPTDCAASGCAVLKNATEPSPPPTLADIERLVHEHETKAISYYKYGANADEANLRQSRAALMAAIRLYGREE